MNILFIFRIEWHHVISYLGVSLLNHPPTAVGEWRINAGNPRDCFNCLADIRNILEGV